MIFMSDAFYHMSDALCDMKNFCGPLAFGRFELHKSTTLYKNQGAHTREIDVYKLHLSKY